jgi:IS5 family transposase
LTTLLKFRRLLQANELTRALFDEINAHLAEQGLLMRAGTIVDATIIAAPSSTKNEGKARDPEMHQTKKGNAWHFGMKADIGVDAESGLVHSVAQSGLTRGSKRGNEGPCAAAEPLKARAARQTPLTAPDVAHRSARP